MPWLTLVLLVVLAPPPSPGTIEGTVTDRLTGTALAGATVAVLPSEKQAATDEEGHFLLGNMPFGAYAVTVSLGGYDIFRENLLLAPEAPVWKKKVVLTPLHSEAEVTVTANQPLLSHATEVSSFTFPAGQVAKTAGSMEDVTRVVQALPGVATEGDFTSLLYVRGGDATETTNYLDGVILFNPYHLGGVFTVFNPDLVEEVNFYAGGFPARYGNTMSGVLNVRYREPRTDRFHLYLDTSLITTKMTAEGPLGGKWGWMVAGRRSYVDVLLKASGLAKGTVVVPEFGDYYAQVAGRPGTRHYLSFRTSWVEDSLQAEAFEDPNHPEARPGNLRFRDGRFAATGEWRFQVTPRFQFRQLASYDTERAKGRLTGTDPYAVDGDAWSITYQNEVLWAPVSWFSLEAGMLAATMRLKADLLLDNFLSTVPGSNVPGNPNEGKLVYHLDWDTPYGGLYLENRFALRDTGVHFSAGVRTDYWDYTKETTVSPRAAVSYDLPADHTVRYSWGDFRQFPTNPIALDRDFGNPDLKAPHATHHVLGWEYRTTPDSKLRIESFYKDYQDLVVNPDTSEAVVGRLLQGEPIFVNRGKGFAYGGELFWQKRLSEHWEGWIAYTYLISRRFNPLNQENPPWYDPRQDQRHTLNLLATYHFGKGWEASGTFTYHSGQPYTPVTGWTLETDEVTGSQVYVSEYGPLNSARFPSYHTLDLRLEKVWKRSKAEWSAYVDIQNVYNRSNLYTYVYEDADPTQNIPPKQKAFRNLPVLPIFGGSVKF